MEEKIKAAIIEALSGIPELCGCLPEVIAISGPRKDVSDGLSYRVDFDVPLPVLFVAEQQSRVFVDSPNESGLLSQLLAESRGVSSGRPDAMNGYSYTGEIAELKAQIEHQRVGSREVQDAMQKQDRRIAELERENRMLKESMALGSPAEMWPDPA